MGWYTLALSLLTAFVVLWGVLFVALTRYVIRTLAAAYPSDLDPVSPAVWTALVAGNRGWLDWHVRALARVGHTVAPSVRVACMPTYLRRVAAGAMPGPTAEHQLAWIAAFLTSTAGRADGTPCGAPGATLRQKDDLLARAQPWIDALGEDLAPLAAACGMRLDQAEAMLARGHLDERELRATARRQGVWVPVYRHRTRHLTKGIPAPSFAVEMTVPEGGAP